METSSSSPLPGPASSSASPAGDDVASVRPRRRRLVIVLIALLIIAGPVVGYFVGRRVVPGLQALGVGKPSANLASLPYSRVQIFDLMQEGEARNFEIDHGGAVNTFRSLFLADDSHRIGDAGKIRKLYILSFDLHPPWGGDRTPDEQIEVWEAPSGLVWTDRKADYRLHGNLPDWFAALPAMRAAQLLQSHTPGQRATGEKLRAVDGPAFIAALVKLLDSENQQLRACAIFHLAPLVQMHNVPWVSSLDWKIVRDQRRSLDAPHAALVARKLMGLIHSPPASPQPGAEPVRSIWDTGRFYDCLVETADQDTTNELARRIAGATNNHGLDPSLTCLEAIYGLPPTYERRGICGHCSQAEIAEFHAAENIRRGEARDKLLAWHTANSAKPRAEQLDAVLEAWRPKLAEFTSSKRHSEIPYPTPAHLFAPLWRVGPELLPAIERRQQAAQDLSERGALEFLKAFLTADCNTKLVDELLAGDVRQQRIACQIIGVSGRRDWTKQLDALQRRRLRDVNPTEFYDVATLMNAATAALWLTLDLEALPLLRQTRQAGFTNQHLEKLIAKHDLPSRP